MFVLPPGLTRLIAEGIWPSRHGPSMNAQQLRPIVSADRVRRFADDESLICLAPPPFRTVADVRGACRSGDFGERFGALDQIDPERALIIGDFGLGSDSPIVRDYAQDTSNPPVSLLRWAPGGHGNVWVQGARDFEAFASSLGFDERPD